MEDKGTVNIGDVRPSERTEPRLKPSRAVGGGKPKGTFIRKEASAMLTQSKCCRTLTQSKCCRTLTYVLASDGSPLMPTFNIKKVRKLLKSGKAVIAGHTPGFTIRLLYEVEAKTQRIEVSVDAGSEHIGLSVKSEKHEFVHRQYDLLDDEKEKHNDCRKYRKARRNRKRHRKPRFDNRKKEKGWIAPSLDNKMNRHVDLIVQYQRVLPITDVVIEVGSFDTQALEAIESGKPLPEGTDYQHGPMYAHDTRREAVFYRDKYTCLLCGDSPFKKKNVILRMHHIGFWKNDRTDRIKNLATLCTKCHSPKNHKKSGKLYGWEPELKPLTGAAFMNTVRWMIVKAVEEKTHIKPKTTYGAVTKRERLSRHLEKTHANDAYCIGDLHPKHRTREERFVKCRRNNRVLEKFKDAVYLDIRDNSKKKASELPCGRTKRSESRNSCKNERRYRGTKLSDGHRSIRRTHYQIRPGDVCEYKGRRFVTTGVSSYGQSVHYKGKKRLSSSEAEPVIDKKTGQAIPIVAGGKCIYKNKTRKVLSAENNTITIEWIYSYNTSDIRCIKHTGGWQQV